MAVISLVGIGAFLIACLVVGIRLLRRAFRTRQMPEFAAGLAFLLAGGVGYQLVVVGRLVMSSQPAMGIVAYAAGLLSLNLGVSCLAFFVWRTFRPDRLGGAVFAVLTSSICAGYVGMALETQFAVPGAVGVWGWAATIARMIVFMWAAAESFLLRARIRRLGEAGDEALCRRLLLWGCGASCATGIFVVAMVYQLGAPLDVRDPWYSLPVALLGLTAAWCLMRAFFGDDEEELFSRPGQEPSGPQGPAR